MLFQKFFGKKENTVPSVIESFAKKGFRAISGLSKEELHEALFWAAGITSSFGESLGGMDRIFESREKLPHDFETIRLALCVQMTFYAATENKSDLSVCRNVYKLLGNFIEITPEEADLMVLSRAEAAQGQDTQHLISVVSEHQELYARASELYRINGEELDRYYNDFFDIGTESGASE